MWYVWFSVLVVTALAEGDSVATTEAASVATTARPAPRTLDRQAAELAWRSWLQSPESGNQNAPPRRITTKSLFITPLVCPKGQRLDRNGCVQVVTVNKDEHERILLEQLNARFPSSPSFDVLYDYGDEEQGPLQLSIPIGIDPQAAPLQAQNVFAQGLIPQTDYNKVKKEETGLNTDASIVAELELLKLQHSHDNASDTMADGTNILNHNVLTNFLPFPDKPKRDSSVVNETEDVGQKEQFYGHVNIDPVVYNTDYQNQQTTTLTPDAVTTIDDLDNPLVEIFNETKLNPDLNVNGTLIEKLQYSNMTQIKNSNNTLNVLKKDNEKSKLNPETDYSDIGEAIKLISRYAEVTTDDNFSKNQKNIEKNDDTILGTRTKLQHRRNKLKQTQAENIKDLVVKAPNHVPQDQVPSFISFPKHDTYYRYPWQTQHSQSPPPDYPFRHLQDYWPGRNQFGGVYKTMHENPRRHHHSFPHSFYYRPHGFPPMAYQAPYYAGQHQGYIQRLEPPRARSSDQDLYSLLGLRHWFSSEGTTKR